MLLAAVGGLVVGVSRTTTVRVPPRRGDRSIVDELRAGFDEVVRSPLMRLVAIAYVLLAILLFSVTYPFLLAASETFHSEADLATALGLLSAAVTATSFVISVVLANRAYARFGVAGAALLLPLVYLGGFGLWLVSLLDRDRGARPLHPAGHPARPVECRLERLLQRRPDASAGRRCSRSTTACRGRSDTVLSGVLMLAAGTFLARDQVFWLGAFTALICTLVVLGIRRRYAREPRCAPCAPASAEQVLEGGPGLGVLTADPSVIAALVDALSAPEPSIRRMAADLLGRTSADGAGPALIAVVDDDADATVRVAALEAIGALGGPPTAVGAAEACLLDPDDTVRVAAIHALTAVADDEAPQGDPAAAGAGPRSEPRGPGRRRVPVRIARTGAAARNGSSRRCWTSRTSRRAWRA